jgi:hypothetical protein
MVELYRQRHYVVCVFVHRRCVTSELYGFDDFGCKLCSISYFIVSTTMLTVSVSYALDCMCNTCL